MSLILEFSVEILGKYRKQKVYNFFLLNFSLSVLSEAHVNLNLKKFYRQLRTDCMLSSPIASLEVMAIKLREKNSAIVHPSFEVRKMK